MKIDASLQARLLFLIRVVQKEGRYLKETDTRLFKESLTVESLQHIAQDSLLAERLDAFVSRFSRLQDTIADKLLPTLLDAMAEHTGATIENLDRAEKLGWLQSTDAWLEMRKLRNQMIHEYIEDLTILTGALNAGHLFVPTLIHTMNQFVAQAQRRLQATRTS